MNKEAVILSVGDLNSLCREWQETLRLQNWDVEVKIVRQRDMSLEDCKGTCNAHFQRANAFIEIVDPIDYDDPEAQDMECDLVHELLHIHLWAFDHTEPGNMENDALERAIIQISHALVNLKRKAIPFKPLSAVLRGGADDNGPELQAG